MKKTTVLCYAGIVVLVVSVIGLGFANGNASQPANAAPNGVPSELAPSVLPSLGIPAVTPTLSVQGSSGLFTFTAIDVGRGDALLLSWPDLSGRTRYMLVDGGTADDWPYVHAYLASHGVMYLDAIVCTHEHDDHLNGLIELLKSGDIGVGAAYDAGFLVCQKGWPEYPKIQEYLALLEKQNIPRQIVGAGDELYTANPAVTIRVLNPDPQHLIITPRKNDTQNANSVALEVTYNQARFLLMGDTLTSSYWQMMKEGYIEQADVLKLSHHGDMPANSPIYKEFLTIVHPKYAIATCGCYRPDYASGWMCQMSSVPKVLAGVSVYRSACSGDITITTNGKTSANGVSYTVTTTQNLPPGACIAECKSTCTADDTD